MTRFFMSVIIAFLVWLGQVTMLSADIVYLTNGERIEGRVVKETPKDITLDFGFGQMVLERQKVTKIEKAPFPADKKEAATEQKKTAEIKPGEAPPTPVMSKTSTTEKVAPAKTSKEPSTLPGVVKAPPSGAPDEGPPPHHKNTSKKTK